MADNNLTWFEVLDAARGPLYGPRRVTLDGPFALREDAERAASVWAGATDPRVQEFIRPITERN
jgi:hypothetical protein